MALSDNPNDLLVQVSLANQQAFHKLYQLTSAKLFAISLRITKQEKLSEEVLQDSFLKIWHNASRFDPDKSQAITWMGTIVRNQSIDMIRKDSKHSFSEELEDEKVGQSDMATPEQLAIEGSDLAAVHLCLDNLESQHKDIILMAYLDGYTHQEIADIKSVPLGSVKTWLHRGIDSVRHCLNKATKGGLS